MSCTEEVFSGSAVAAALRSRSPKHKRFRRSIVAKTCQNVNKCTRLIYIFRHPRNRTTRRCRRPRRWRRWAFGFSKSKNKKFDWASGLWSKPANGRAVRAAHCPHAARQAQCGQLAHRRWRRLSTGAVLAPVGRPVVHHEADTNCRQGSTHVSRPCAQRTPTRRRRHGFPPLQRGHYLINK